MKKLDAMLGRTYIYSNDEHTIQSIDEIEDQTGIYLVTTDKKKFKLREKQILMDFRLSTKSNGSTEITALMRIIEDKTAPTDGLVATLLENIAKLKDTPGYIEQARAINDHAKTILDIKKTQIEVMRLAVDLRK
jgi:hypothetical protein